MAGKFMKISRIVLPFMTVVILASQLMGCAAIPKDQFLEEIQKADEVVIEYVEPDQTPLAGPTDKGSSYDYETNTVSTSTESAEAEIGLVETTQKSKPTLGGQELQQYFQLAYDCCLAFDGNTYEDQVKLEISTLVDVCKSYAGDKQLPDDYASSYKSWRAKQSDSRYAVADITSSSESQQALEFSDCNETVYATSQVNIRSGPGTNYDKVGSLSTGNSAVRTGIGYNSCDGWSRIQLSDGSIVYVSSNYISTTKPVAQTPSSTPSSVTNQNNNNGQPGVNSDLANSGLDFSGPSNIITPGAGKTQEELEAEWAEIDEVNKDYTIYGG